MEKSDEFDESLAIRQSFPYQYFTLSLIAIDRVVICVGEYNDSSKFYSSNFLTCLIRQISSDFSTVKVLRYTVCYKARRENLPQKEVR